MYHSTKSFSSTCLLTLLKTKPLKLPVYSFHSNNSFTYLLYKDNLRSICILKSVNESDLTSAFTLFAKFKQSIETNE